MSALPASARTFCSVAVLAIGFALYVRGVMGVSLRGLTGRDAAR